jgi:hypothetical protein
VDRLTRRNAVASLMVRSPFSLGVSMAYVTSCGQGPDDASQNPLGSLSFRTVRPAYLGGVGGRTSPPPVAPVQPKPTLQTSCARHRLFSELHPELLMDHGCTPVGVLLEERAGSLLDGRGKFGFLPTAPGVVGGEALVTAFPISPPQDADGTGMQTQVCRDVGLVLTLPATRDDFSANIQGDSSWHTVEPLPPFDVSSNVRCRWIFAEASVQARHSIQGS